jgi:hypothetical protein
MGDRRFVVCAFALALLSGSRAEARSHCVQYDPAQVTIRGRIFLRTDFGPPNYGEDPSTDSRERHIYIRLDKVLCVDEDAEGEAERGVHVMQMAYMIHQPFRRAWVGKHVSVRGTLFHSFTGHHWTKVLIAPIATKVLP